ncbi:MAG: segregation/condensation protein A [Candidatus Neomarinimicrobiota bacterium]
MQLENFQGPLDLLLFFIRRDEIDIYDIPIAHITREFMDTLDLMHSLNISVAGEFINMAATLMQIKSRMLLPRPQDYDFGANEDPRTELVRQLLEYQRFKETAGNFKRLELERSQVFTRQALASVPDIDEDPGVYLREVSLFDLARHFKAAMDAMPVINSYDLQREPVNLGDQKALVLRLFNAEGRLSFRTIVAHLKTKLEVVVTFMAILDLVRLEQIKVFQSRLFADPELHLIVNRA